MVQIENGRERRVLEGLMEQSRIKKEMLVMKKEWTAMDFCRSFEPCKSVGDENWEIFSDFRRQVMGWTREMLPRAVQYIKK